MTGNPGRFDWGNGPPPLQDHSAKKLELYERYLTESLRIQGKPALQPNGIFRFYVVDAFAGGGTYENGELGSGLRILQTVERMEAEILSEWKGDPSERPRWNCRIWLNDASANNIHSLKKTLREHGHQVDDERLVVTCLPLHDLVPKLKPWAKPTPRHAGKTLVLLDQQGFKDVSLEDLSRILDDLPHSEIVLTVAAAALLERRWEDPKVWRPDGAGDRLIRPEIRRLIQLQKDERNEALRDPSLPEWQKHQLMEFLKREQLQLILQPLAVRAFSCFTIRHQVGGQYMWIIHMVRNPKDAVNVLARDTLLDCEWAMDGVLTHLAGSPLHYLGYKGLKEGDPDPYSLDLFSDKQSETVHDVAQEILSEHRKLWRGPDGISVATLLALIQNRSALTSEMQRQAIAEAVRMDPATVLRNDRGRERKFRQGENQTIRASPTDRLYLSRQISLF